MTGRELAAVRVQEEHGLGDGRGGRPQAGVVQGEEQVGEAVQVHVPHTGGEQAQGGGARVRGQEPGDKLVQGP